MPIVELAALLVGAALLLMARRQRVQALRQRRRVLRQAFASPDPGVRRAAIQVAGDEGLSRSADVFVDLLARERDPTVLLALARVVVRNQWEPARDPTMLRLRLWAHRYLDQIRPKEQPLFGAVRPAEYQGPSVGEVVNLMLQPSSRSEHTNGRRRRPRPHRTSRRRPTPPTRGDQPWA